MSAKPHGRPHATPSPMTGRRLVLARTVWVSVAVVVLGMALTGLALASQRPELAGPDVIVAAYARFGIPVAVGLYGLLVPVLVVYTATSFIVFLHRSDELLPMLVALALLLQGAVEFVVAVERAYPGVPGPGFILNLTCVVWALLLFVFPDGRFVPTWTRWPVCLVLVLLVFLDFGGLLFRLPDIPDNAPGWQILTTLFITIALIILGFAAQIYRFRHFSGWMERQQVKWVMLPLAASYTYFLVALGLPSLFWEPAEWFGWVMLAGTVPMLLVPTSVAVAILRYKLFDIDYIINRTLVYSTLTVAIFAVYVLIVGFAGSRLPVDSDRILALATTGIVAVIFQPLRERLQRTVNRLMYGERDDPYSVLSRLGRRLEETLVPDAVLPTFVETVARTLHLPYAAVRLELSGDARGPVSAAYPIGQTGPSPAQLLHIRSSIRARSWGGWSLRGVRPASHSGLPTASC
jgi:hypothetical protein